MQKQPEGKVSLSQLLRQAQERVREEVLGLLKETSEGLLEALRDEVVGRGRYERREAPRLYRYGYRVRKFLETSWGTIVRVKIPRVRGPEGEVGFLEGYERKLWVIAEQLLFGFAQGMSLRSLCAWLRGFALPVACPSTLGEVIQEKVLELRKRREGPLDSGGYVALVLDGVWFKRRKGRKRMVLLVAIGVRVDGGFEVLDWEGSASESASSYERLLTRLYLRGLEEVELISSDEAQGIWEAVDMVYPLSKKQICLWHLQRRLEGMLSRRDFSYRREFRRAYWWIFEAEDLREARERFEAFLGQWRKEPEVVRALRMREGRLFEYLRLPYWWRKRVRTTKGGENFFRHLRTFLGRFPGFKDEGHLECAFATYLLSQREKMRVGRDTPYQLQWNFNTRG